MCYTEKNGMPLRRKSCTVWRRTATRIMWIPGTYWSASASNAKRTCAATSGSEKTKPGADLAGYVHFVCGMSFYFGSIQTAENAEDVQGANMGVLEVVITAAMILLATGLSVILVNRKFKQESIELLNRKSD